MAADRSMMGASVNVLICTFRRAAVTRTLASLATQELPEGTRMCVIVADNDDSPSAREFVETAARDLPYRVTYLHAPRRNISIARNACMDVADADYIAFLDDDEWVGPQWLATLMHVAAEAGADGVFGPVLADYDCDAPDWIRDGDYHSSIPVRRNGVVETGISGNVLLRWRGAPWRAERFDLARGRSGGEDTEFFFRLRRMGARYAIAEEACAWESVPEARLTLGWLARRRYRMGQSYSASTDTARARARLALTAAGKAGYCAIRALIGAPSRAGRNFWLLRGLLHVGVCAGCLKLRQAEHYGETDPPKP